MTDDPRPRRYLDPAELSVEQLIAREQALSRGQTEPKFDNPEWNRAARQALIDAGLEGETVGEPDSGPWLAESWRRYSENRETQTRERLGIPREGPVDD